MNNRRQEERVPVKKPAAIHCKTSKKPLKCVITDLSSHGAKLRLKKRASLSDKILLVVHGDNLRLEAAIRWFDGAHCGVQFERQIAHPHLTRHRMRSGIGQEAMAQSA